jgi:hypothetical protein
VPKRNTGRSWAEVERVTIKTGDTSTSVATTTMSERRQNFRII